MTDGVTEAVNRAERAETETWLRASGLPWLVRPRYRASHLVARMSPLLASLVAFSLVDVTFEIVADDTADAAAALLAIALVLLLLIAAPIVVLLVVARLARRHRDRMTAVGWILVGYLLVVDPFFGGQISGDPGTPEAFVGNIAAVVGFALATWLGIGSILGWALATAAGHLAALERLTSRALPLLMLVVVFAFFSQSTWQVTDALPVGRLLVVALFFVALGLFSVSVVVRSELRDLDGSISAEQRRALVAASELSFLSSRAPAVGPRLSRLERINLNLVLVLAQGLQVVLFGAVVFVFLVVLGAVAITPAVVEVWLGHPPVAATLVGVPLPLDATLLRTALLLSAIASLNFVIAVITDASYRLAFYEPLLDRVRVALAVRAAYRGSDASTG